MAHHVQVEVQDQVDLLQVAHLRSVEVVDQDQEEAVVEMLLVLLENRAVRQSVVLNQSVKSVKSLTNLWKLPN